MIFAFVAQRHEFYNSKNTVTVTVSCGYPVPLRVNRCTIVAVTLSGLH